MRLLLKAAWGALLLATLVLAGCGSTAAPAPSVQKISVTSAAIGGKSLPARYTCDGRDTPPPLEWGAVPADTGSMVLFVVGVTPEPATKTYSLAVDWTVAGLDPGLHRLVPGPLPRGAYVGLGAHNKRKYVLCPKKGQLEQYQFELYGLPKGDTVVRDFVGLPLLARLANVKTTPANAHGALIAVYKRT